VSLRERVAVGLKERERGAVGVNIVGGRMNGRASLKEKSFWWADMREGGSSDGKSSSVVLENVLALSPTTRQEKVVRRTRAQ